MMEPFADGRATETEGLDLSAARTHSCADVITNSYGHYFLVFGRGARTAQEWRRVAPAEEADDGSPTAPLAVILLNGRGMNIPTDRSGTTWPLTSECGAANTGEGPGKG